MDSENKGNQCGSSVNAADGVVRIKFDAMFNFSSTFNMLNDVKERFCEQREALPGEPICTICGRYGEYICDETEDDICSLECKKILLTKIVKPQFPPNIPPPRRLPTTDDCVYVRDSNIKSRAKALVTDQTVMLREKLKIFVSGESVPPPILSFACCNIPETLQQNLEVSGFEIPTPVQMQAIPAALNGQSLLVSAATGSGKTASYLVPIVSYCTKCKSSKKPISIVLAPTREICVQVEEQAKLLGKGLPFKTALVVGGDPMPQQIHRINQGVKLIVATPGRLIDLLTKNDIELDAVSILVLDEVDCMLNSGFIEQVMQIFRALSQPQVLMYSATISKEIEKIANAMAKSVSVISIDKPNGAVKQVAIWVETRQKKQKLFDILSSKQHFRPPVVVFVGSKLGADLLSDAIRVTAGLKALAIHGDKSMKERREILKSFLVGDVPVIVATGVLGRGVDLLSVRQVIIFDMPYSIKEYVHQIGRASRLGEEGEALVFVNEENHKIFAELVEILKSSGAPIPRELTNSGCTVSCHKKRKYR